MESPLNSITINVNEKIFSKDPLSSDLGKRITESGALLINELGFEDFNFKKLSNHISTTEASIYRYFENKHRLLIYITSLYWGWQEYRLAFATANVEDAKKSIEKAIAVLLDEGKGEVISGIKMEILNQILISESAKVYLVKEVDEVNQYGFYLGYKTLCMRLAEIIKHYNPTYKYPQALSSTVFETIQNQKYFAAHLPRLTDAGSEKEKMKEFLLDLIINTAKAS